MQEALDTPARRFLRCRTARPIETDTLLVADPRTRVRKLIE